MEQFNKNEFKKEFTDSKDDFSSYINELVKELKNDNDVYNSLESLKLTVKEVKNNIAKLIDYKEDFNFCKNCPGLKKCNKNNPLTQMSLRKEGSYINIDFTPCKEVVKQMQIDSNYIIDDFPQEWKNNLFDKLDLDTNRNRRLIIKQFKECLNGSNRWIYLFGNKRVGKSYLLVTLANEFINLGYGKVGVVSFPKLVSSLMDYFYQDKETFNKQFDMLIKAPLLIIDDFGDEYKSEYIRDTITIPLINERASKNKLTFFGSEFTMKEVASMYNLSKTNGLIRSRQLLTNLQGMCKEEFDLSGTVVY